MNDEDLGRAADENLAAAWLALTRANGGDVVEGDSMALAATGLPIAFFNGGYVRRCADDLPARLDDAVAFFAERTLPFLAWVRDGLCPSVVDAGRRAGLAETAGPPAMGIDPLPPIPEPPPRLEISIATTVNDLADHAQMLSEGFEMPRELVDRLVQPGMLDGSDIATFVGRVDGEPVSCSLLAVSGATAGVYNVATPARHRGRGYGAALTWAVLAEGAARGCTHGVLQASGAGYPVYRRMGFRDLGRYVHLQGPAS